MDTNIVDVEKSLKIIQATIRRRISSIRANSSKSSSIRTNSTSSIRKNSSSSMRTSKNVFISETIDDNSNFKNALKISKFLKSKLIIDKYTLENRVRFLNYIINKLKDIRNDDCLEKKQFKDRI